MRMVYPALFSFSASSLQPAQLAQLEHLANHSTVTGTWSHPLPSQILLAVGRIVLIQGASNIAAGATQQEAHFLASSASACEYRSAAILISGLIPCVLKN